MKQSIKYILVFLIGAAVGVFVVQSKAKRNGRLESEAIITRWKQSVPLMTAMYYRPGRQVPVPLNLDLSTNTWPQLSFWCGFARAYQVLKDDDLKERHRIETPAFPFDDPAWPQVASQLFGAEFAKEAFRKSKEGLSQRELVDWVTRHCPTNATEDQSEYWLKVANGFK